MNNIYFTEYQFILLVLLATLVTLLILLKIRENKLKDTRAKLASATLELHNTQDELQGKCQELMYNQMQLGINEEKYNLIIEASNDGIWDYDLVKNKRFQSARFLEKLGYKETDLNDQEDWHRLIHTSDLERVLEAINQYWIDKTDYYECEYRLRDINNKYIWIKEREEKYSLMRQAILIG